MCLLIVKSAEEVTYNLILTVVVGLHIVPQGLCISMLFRLAQIGRLWCSHIHRSKFIMPNTPVIASQVMKGSDI